MEVFIKWFKHYSNVNESIVLSTILEEMGNEGYGLYWRIMELISSNYDGESTVFEFRTSIVRRKLGLRTNNKLAKIALLIGHNGAINIVLKKDIVIFNAPILAKLKDRDFRKSRQCRANNALEENRLDKNRLDKEKSAPVKKLTDRVDYNFYSNCWNVLTANKLPQVKILTDARKRSLKTLIGKFKDLDFQVEFEDYVGKVTESDFLCGSSGWKATFDWAIKVTNYTKVIEGNYKNKTGGVSNSEKLLAEMTPEERAEMGL